MNRIKIRRVFFGSLLALYLTSMTVWPSTANNEYQDDRAFREYTKAVQLAPDWAAANYYYGYEWQRLDPKSKIKMAHAASARATFQKSTVINEGEI